MRNDVAGAWRRAVEKWLRGLAYKNFYAMIPFVDSMGSNQKIFSEGLSP